MSEEMCCYKCEENHKTINTIKYKVQSQNLFKPKSKQIYIKEPYSIHLV